MQPGSAEIDTGNRQTAGGEKIAQSAELAHGVCRWVLAVEGPAHRPVPRRTSTPAHRVGGEDDDRGHVVVEPSVEDDCVGAR